MNEILRKLNKYFTHSDSWLFFVLIVIISHVGAEIQQVLSASTFLGNLLILLLCFSPLLVLDYYRAVLKQKWKVPYFDVYYVASQIIYLSILNLLNVGIPETGHLIPIEEELLVMASIYVVILEIIIKLFHYSKHKIRLFEKVRRISLDRALILVLLIISGLLSVLIASNKEQLLQHRTLDIQVDYVALFRNFPFFLGVWLQLFITYMGGFFFYYVNAHFLIAKLLKKRGVLYYIAGALGLIFIFYPIIGSIINQLPLHQLSPILLPSENYDVFDPVNRAIAFGIVLISLPITLVFQWFQQNNDIINLQKQQVETELNLLKQQINPHFFFNTLNNLYALSLAKSEQTPEVIMQLSDLMRYVIYKGNQEKVLLIEEIQYLEDYIKLQKLRHRKSIDLDFRKEIHNPSLQISPLLLIILVENAFKHGIEPAEEAAKLEIIINDRQDILNFTCINSIEKPTKLNGGLGLINLKRRLELVYSGKYSLVTDIQNKSYSTHLKIELR